MPFYLRMRKLQLEGYMQRVQFSALYQHDASVAEDHCNIHDLLDKELFYFGMESRDKPYI